MSVHNTNRFKIERWSRAAGLDTTPTPETPEFAVGQITRVGSITALKLWGGMVWVTIGGQSITQRLLKARLAHRPTLTSAYRETVYPQPEPTHGFSPLTIQQTVQQATSFIGQFNEKHPSGCLRKAS